MLIAFLFAWRFARGNEHYGGLSCVVRLHHYLLYLDCSLIGVAFLLLLSLESIVTNALVVDGHLVANLRGTGHFGACLVSFI